MDVTEARTREAALAQSEARLKLLADHVTDVVLWISAGGKILYASPSVESLGYAPEAMVGRALADYILPGGAFIKACEGMPRERIALPWLDRHLPIAPAEMAQMRSRLRDTGVAVVGESMPVDEATANGVELKFAPRAPRTPSRRVKHECPGCRARAWAPPETRLSCGACAQALVAMLNNAYAIGYISAKKESKKRIVLFPGHSH
jgi:hypothetical protein